MTRYQEYDVENVICHQKVSSIYYSPGDEALSKIIDLHITGYTWELVASWINETTETDTFTQEYSCGYKVTEGTEAETHWKATGEFKGLGIEIGGSSKNFSSQETSESAKITRTINVGPNSSLYFYQKRYKFKPEVWFILDAWNENWTVGSRNSYVYARVDECVDIDSSEFLTTPSAVSGKAPGSLTCTSQSDLKHPGDTRVRKFENCTTRCQENLINKGVQL